MTARRQFVTFIRSEIWSL